MTSNASEVIKRETFFLSSESGKKTRVGSAYKRKTTKKTQEKCFSVSWFKDFFLPAFWLQRGMCERRSNERNCAKTSACEAFLLSQKGLFFRFGPQSPDHAKWKHFRYAEITKMNFWMKQIFRVLSVGGWRSDTRYSRLAIMINLYLIFFYR